MFVTYRYVKLVPVDQMIGFHVWLYAVKNSCFDNLSETITFLGHHLLPIKRTDSAGHIIGLILIKIDI